MEESLLLLLLLLPVKSEPAVTPCRPPASLMSPRVNLLHSHAVPHMLLDNSCVDVRCRSGSWAESKSCSQRCSRSCNSAACRVSGLAAASQACCSSSACSSCCRCCSCCCCCSSCRASSYSPDRLAADSCRASLLDPARRASRRCRASGFETPAPVVSGSCARLVDDNIEGSPDSFADAHSKLASSAAEKPSICKLQACRWRASHVLPGWCSSVARACKLLASSCGLLCCSCGSRVAKRECRRLDGRLAEACSLESAHSVLEDCRAEYCASFGWMRSVRV